MTPLTRRAFVQVSVSAGLALGGGSIIGCGHGGAFDDDTLLRPQLLDGLGQDAVRALGVSYRAAAPQEATAAALREALASAARADRPWPWSPLPTLEALVRADFAADRVISVDGWLLAVTEARQCALVSLG